jgi:hypothetical protein
MTAVFEIILTMILTIVVLLGGGYVLLTILEWGLRIKSGRREEDGLSQLWASNQAGKPDPKPQDEQVRKS